MKLYVYDHCPYCVKARMIFGFKQIPFELITLADDDIKTPTSMIGVKMTPILEKDSGSFMPESLDIISYVDQMKTPEIISSWKEDKKLSSWLDGLGGLHYQLAVPRWSKSPLEDFKTESAKKYFQNRMEPKIGLFSDLLKESSDLKKEMEEELLQLEQLLKSENFYFQKKLSVDDFHLFAVLRSLTIVKDLKFPKKVAGYIKNMSEKSKVSLYTSMAL